MQVIVRRFRPAATCFIPQAACPARSGTLPWTGPPSQVEHRLGHASAAKPAALEVRVGAMLGTVWAGAEIELLTAERDAALPASK